MSQILEIDLLKTFHTVARLRKFRAAAEHLHKSPAAISVHIQRLESIAGGRLFERDNRAVSLTPLGSRLFDNTVELLAVHDRALRDLNGPEASGRVLLGIPDEYVLHVIEDILPMFSATWPNVVLEVKTAPSGALREDVSKGKLDLAVVAQLADPRQGRGELLQMTTPVWVGRPRFGVQHEQPLPLALYAAPCPYRVAMTSALDEAGISWRVILDTPSGNAVKACVESGIGVSVVDRSRITPEMTVLEHLPELAEHEIVLVHADETDRQSLEAIAVLTNALKARFRI